ncbi:hypothetical protein Mgra_00006722 [Meloidogyne graminicola]|uniref:Uncharacterized protein n=1 Tax=Meloidogyne graminicola TaxID=189291 RepID=A0A8S9ZKQ9_9BILA|nr:hypothetical protein Mgra_00006722 [Meloidogyne graminicola]
MQIIQHIIKRTIEVTNYGDAASQMQLIRRIMEDIYGGSWGVLIIKGINLISKSVHWTIPDHKHKDGTEAFCLYTENGIQYNIFKTGDKDTENRITLEQAMAKIINNIKNK